MPTTHRAAVVRRPSGPESVEIVHVPIAEPGPGEVRVRVAAAAVNPVDLGVAEGFFHQLGLVDQPDHTGLGWDLAGVVDRVGPGRSDLAVGDRVFGFVPLMPPVHEGTFAEYVAGSGVVLAPIPAGVSISRRRLSKIVFRCP